jgi:EF hand
MSFQKAARLPFPSPPKRRAAFIQSIPEPPNGSFSLMLKRTIAITLAAHVALIAGAAYAQQSGERPRLDADRDRTISRAEYQTQTAAMFARLDANRDGKIDTADREARMADRFMAMDTDKNGQVSRDEFIAAQRARHTADGAHSAHGEDGGKMHGAMMRRGPGAGGGMMLVRMADTNRDQAVTRAEFDAASTLRFIRIDANKDGKLSPEERRNAHSAMRGMHRSPPPPATKPL